MMVVRCNINLSVLCYFYASTSSKLDLNDVITLPLATICKSCVPCHRLVWRAAVITVVQLVFQVYEDVCDVLLIYYSYV